MMTLTHHQIGRPGGPAVRCCGTLTLRPASWLLDGQSRVRCDDVGMAQREAQRRLTLRHQHSPTALIGSRLNSVRLEIEAVGDDLDGGREALPCT